MQFSSLRGSDSEAEESGGLGVSLRLESCEGSRVTFDRLRALALYRVELHGAYHAVLLGRDTCGMVTNGINTVKRRKEFCNSSVHWRAGGRFRRTYNDQDQRLEIKAKITATSEHV